MRVTANISRVSYEPAVSLVSSNYPEGWTTDEYPLVDDVPTLFGNSWEYRWNSCTVRFTDNDPKRTCLQYVVCLRN